MTGTWVSYLRVSTDRQGKSGLGLEAQRSAVARYLNGGKLVKEFVEVESGKKNDRPMLEQALGTCRLYGAKLVIAKLDRLSRNAHFLLGLKEAGVDFVAADMPNANRLTVGIMALVAEDEGRAISQRTKDALAASSKKLGGRRYWPDGRVITPSREAQLAGVMARQKRAAARAADIAPAIQQLRADGAESLGAIARGLNAAGVPTASGRGQWSASTVGKMMERL